MLGRIGYDFIQPYVKEWTLEKTLIVQNNSRNLYHTRYRIVGRELPKMWAFRVMRPILYPVSSTKLYAQRDMIK